MSLGECIDSSLQNTVNLMEGVDAAFNPSMFVNPQTQIISGLVSGGVNRQNAILDFLATGPGFGAAADAIALHNTITGLVGGQSLLSIGGPPLHVPVYGPFGGFPAMSQYSAITDFLSGKASFFPISAIDSSINPKLVLLGTLSFASLLGIAQGGRMTDNLLCRTDPNDPCKAINGIFNAILGGYNTVINTMLAGLQVMTDFENQALAYLAQVQAFINQIIGFVADTIAAIIDAMFKAMRYALAKLLHALGGDSCMGQVIQQIAGSDLLVALAPVLPHP
jgi:hypothetical protein